MSLANVSVVGNLVRDPEEFRFESGRKKASFHIAVNGYDRETKEKYAEYYKVETWDRLADLAIQYLRKGNQVTVIGRLALNRWQDKNGRDRCTPLVYASQLSLPQKSTQKETVQKQTTRIDSSDLEEKRDVTDRDKNTITEEQVEVGVEEGQKKRISAQSNSEERIEKEIKSTFSGTEVQESSPTKRKTREGKICA